VQVQGQVLGQHTWELAKERLAARSQVTVPRMVRRAPALQSASLDQGPRTERPCLADLALLAGRLGTSRQPPRLCMALLLLWGGFTDTRPPMHICMKPPCRSSAVSQP